MLYKMSPGQRGTFKVSKMTGKRMQALGTITKNGEFKPRPGVSASDRSIVRDLAAQR